MALAEITYIDDYLAYIGKKESISDADRQLITRLKPRVEAAVRKYVGCTITSGTYTHFFPIGNPFDARNGISVGTEEIFLPEWPVRTITSLFEDSNARFGQQAGAFPASSELIAGTDWHQEYRVSGFNPQGKLIRNVGAWYKIPGSYKCVYTAGWTAAELRGEVTDPEKDGGDISLAVWMTLSEFFTQVKRSVSGTGPVKSETLGDYSVEYAVAESGSTITIPKDARNLLAPFRRIIMP